MKNFVVSCVCAVMLVSMVGMPALAEDKTLEFWMLVEEATEPYYSSVVESFNTANPEVTVVLRPYANEEYKTALQVAIGSGNPPDVFFNWAGDDTGRLVREGHLLDLTPYAQQAGWAEPVSAAALDAFSFDGKLYGVPYSQEAKYFYYNKAIFEQEGFTVPTTFNELLGLCEPLKAKGLVPLAIGNSERWHGVHYMSILNQKMAGEQTIAADYTLTASEDDLFTSPGYVAALEKLLDIQNAGCFPPAVNSIAPSAAWAQFYTEQAAMIYAGTWAIGIFKDGGFEDYGMFRMPPIEGAPGNQNYVLMGPIGLEVSAKTAYPEEAVKFASSIVSQVNQRNIVEMAKRLPVRADALQEGDPWEFQFVAEDLAQAEGAVTWLDVILENRVSEVYLNGIQEVLAGTKTPQQVMDAVRARALEVKKELGR